MKRNMSLWKKGVIGVIACGLLTTLTFASFPVTGTETVSAASAKAGYDVSGATVTVSAEKMKTSGAQAAIREAVNYAASKAGAANPYTVKVPSGTYDLDGCIYLGNNIRLDLTGVVLKETKTSSNMLVLDNAHNTKAYGDGTVGNSTVVGGTFMGNDTNTSSMIRMAHAKNITFDGCTFSGGGCAHQMEVASINGFTVKNCTFRDAKGNGSQEKQEALQLDIPCSTYVFKEVELDGTPMKNVTITGCTFRNVLRGLGTHSMLTGVYHENIKITDNIFENVDGECIIGLNYKNCKITGNKIRNCGAGILFQNFKPGVKAIYSTIYDGSVAVNKPVDNRANVTIAKNDITLSSGGHPDEAVGIKVYGYELKKNTKATGIGSKDTIPKGDYGVSGVTIENNKITTCGHGIHLLHVSNAQLSGNTIKNNKKNSQKDGIFIEFGSKGLTISKNTISAASRYGIFLKDKSVAKNITGNKISGAGSFGIGLYEQSEVSGSIAKNTVLNTKSHGISISKKCYVKSINNNIVKGCGEYPIFINTTSKKTIVVKNNRLQAGKNNKKIVVLNGKVKES